MERSGGVEDPGEYLVVWTREEGEWRLAADRFNPSAPSAGSGDT